MKTAIEGKKLLEAAKTPSERKTADDVLQQGDDLLDKNWGDFVLEAYKDVKRSNPFPK